MATLHKVGQAEEEEEEEEVCKTLFSQEIRDLYGTTMF